MRTSHLSEKNAADIAAHTHVSAYIKNNAKREAERAREGDTEQHEEKRGKNNQHNEITLLGGLQTTRTTTETQK